MLLIYTVFLPYFIKLYTVIYIYIYLKCYLMGEKYLDIYPEGLNVGTEMVSHPPPEVNR